jgi:hypothetical protein
VDADLPRPRQVPRGPDGSLHRSIATWIPWCSALAAHPGGPVTIGEKELTPLAWERPCSRTRARSRLPADCRTAARIVPSVPGLLVAKTRAGVGSAPQQQLKHRSGVFAVLRAYSDRPGDSVREVGPIALQNSPVIVVGVLHAALGERDESACLVAGMRTSHDKSEGLLMAEARVTVRRSLRTAHEANS